ncbi:hypothetical protein D9M70_552610 [compost metagenome]
MLAVVGHEQTLLAVAIDPRRVAAGTSAMGHLQGFDVHRDNAVVAAGSDVEGVFVAAEAIALRLTAGLQRQRRDGRVLRLEAGHRVAQQIEGEGSLTVAGQRYQMTLVTAGGDRPVGHVAQVRFVENQQGRVTLAEDVEAILLIHRQAVWAEVRPDVQRAHVLALLQIDDEHRTATLAFVAGGLDAVMTDVCEAVLRVDDELMGKVR